MLKCSEIQLNREIAETLYLQLKRELLRLIREQNPDTEVSLPSERTLSSQLGIHRATVHRVYAELEEKDFIRRKNSREFILHPAARRKLEGQVPSIGVLLPSSFSDYTSNWRRLEYLKGIIDRAAGAGYAVLMLQPPLSDASPKCVDEFINQRLSGLSGVIHLGSRKSEYDPVLETICSYTGIPQVCISGMMKDFSHIGAVFCGFRKAAEDVGRILKARGTQRCCVLRNSRQILDSSGCRPAFLYAASGRSFQMKQYLEEQQLCVSDEWNVANETLEKTLMAQLKKKKIPDFIWCSSDDEAALLWECCRKRKIRVPEDLAIAGFDGAAGTLGRIATIRHPFREMGNAAVDMLIEHFKYGVNDQNKFRTLECVFVPGDSLTE